MKVGTGLPVQPGLPPSSRDNLCWPCVPRNPNLCSHVPVILPSSFPPLHVVCFCLSTFLSPVVPSSLPSSTLKSLPLGLAWEDCSCSDLEAPEVLDSLRPRLSEAPRPLHWAHTGPLSSVYQILTRPVG